MEKHQKGCLRQAWLIFQFYISLEFIGGEGNGNPFQYSCLENSSNRGAWWTAVHGIAQSQTRLKWLSSSSSRVHRKECYSSQNLWWFARKQVDFQLSYHLCLPESSFTHTKMHFILVCCSVTKSCPTLSVPMNSSNRVLYSSLFPWVSSNWCPVESVMLYNHLLIHRPLLLLPSIFPSIRVFSNETAVCIRWSKYWSFSFSALQELILILSNRNV